MAFDQTTFALVGAHSADTPKIYSYKTPDNIITVTADDYFIDKRFQLSVGDAILVSISDVTTIINITEASDSTVKSTEFTAPSSAEVLVKSLADLPDPVLLDGVLTIIPGDGQFLQNNDIDSAFPLALPGAGNRTTWRTINRAIWSYTGTDSCFRDTDAEGDFETQGLVEFQAPNGNMWEFDNTSGNSWSFQASDVPRFTNTNTLGTVKGGTGGGGFNVHFGSITNFDQGLIFEDLFFFEINQVFVFGNNQVGCVHFTGQGAGTSGSINFITPTVSIGSNETVFDMKPAIQAGMDSLNFRGCEQEGGINGTVFAPGSLTQRSLKTISVGNNFIPDSKVIGSSFVKDNATTTSVAVSRTFNDIDFGTLSAGSNLERFTLTNTSNGEKRYDGEVDFEGEMLVTFSALSTGGSRVF